MSEHPTRNTCTAYCSKMLSLAAMEWVRPTILKALRVPGGQAGTIPGEELERLGKRLQRRITQIERIRGDLAIRLLVLRVPLRRDPGANWNDLDLGKRPSAFRCQGWRALVPLAAPALRYSATRAADASPVFQIGMVDAFVVHAGKGVGSHLRARWPGECEAA